MTVLIYLFCFIIASLIQTALSYMLDAGAVAGIPGVLVFYLLAWYAARKWSASYRERKAAKKAQKDYNRNHETYKTDDK